MRLLQVQVRSADVADVLETAVGHGAHRPLAVRAERVRGEAAEADGPRSMIFLELPNDRVGAFVDDVKRVVDEAEFLLLPAGALPLNTPIDRVHERVRDVSRLSTLELVLASLQSIGAWKGMLLFSALAGVIGAYGLIFDASYMLVAAMLVNPMGAPALVSVVALAIGDVRMFGRGGLRFLVSLGVQALAALLLGMAYGLEVSTAMIEQVSALSLWGAVIALVAGAAGAQAQVKSERDSLVSGTAAGFMVAAALAPPAAVLGLSLPLGRSDYATQMVWLLAMQYVCIVVGGWIVLHLRGVRGSDPSLSRGNAGARGVLAVSLLVVALGLVAFQRGAGPRFMKADHSRTALEVARDAVAAVPGAGLVEVSARFTRAALERHEQETMLVDVVVENTGTQPDDAVARAVRTQIRARTASAIRGVTPLVVVTVVPAAAVELRRPE